MGDLKRPWWEHYGRITTRPMDLAPDLVRSYQRVCQAFIHAHAAEAERHGWQPAHLLGPKGLGRSWALVEFMPAVIRFEDAAMIYPSPSQKFAVARQARRDGSVGLICGEAYFAMCGRHLDLIDASASS